MPLVTESKAAQHLTFRPDLQGLRAVAILLVVLAHAGVPWFAGGFVGVDVFFVLSGYLISGLLIREFEQRGAISLVDFYARRLKRLLPALVVMVVVTMALANWLLSPYEAAVQLASAPYASTWTSNFYFVFTTLDYFNELAARDLFLHTWSLGVEEQFYLVWPFLLMALILTNPACQFAGSRRSRVVILGAVALASFWFSQYLSARWPHAAFYMMPSRIWQFALGAMAYVAFAPEAPGSDAGTRICSFSTTISWTALAGGLALIVGSAVGLHPKLAYPGYWALLPSSGAALVIIAGHGLAGGHAGPLAHKALVWLGDRSYSWYLWHWPILALGYSLGFQYESSYVLGLVLLSLLASMVTYKYIELPFWKGSWSNVRSIRVLPASVFLMAAVTGASVYGLRNMEGINEHLDHSYRWRVDLPAIYSDTCDAWYEHARVEPCVFGHEEANRTVVLLGDSIGVQWFSVVPEIFPAPEWATIVLTKSACPMVDEDFYYPRIGSIFHICTEWRNAVLDELDRHNPDVVIMGSAATYDFSESQWIDGSRRLLERVGKAAGTVIVIPGTPALGIDGPSCISRHLASGGFASRTACSAHDRLVAPMAVSGFLARATETVHNAHALDLNDLVCPGEICSAQHDDGLVVFRDSQHLTDTFVRAQSAAIRERVRPILKWSSASQ